MLRGINVGTGRKVLMADLKKLCEDLGLMKVQTYIQSGNVIFELSDPESVPNLENRMHQAFTETYGFNIPVLIRTAEEWIEMIAINPFLKEETEIEKLHLTVLMDEPSHELVIKIKELIFLPDRFEIIGSNVFIFCENGYGRTKITNDFFEKKLKTNATTRNWKTVMKLHEILTN